MTSELIPGRHIYDVTVNAHLREMVDDVVHEQCTVIKFYVKLGKNMPEIKEDLQKVYGDSRFTNSCIHKWFYRFSDGRKSVKDDTHSGRKVTVSTYKRIAAIEEYVMKDRRITVRQVGENFDIGYGTAQDILTNVLGMRRVCARWVPRLLVPEQKAVRVQICTELQQRLSHADDSFLNKVITCDETWFHLFEPESKQQSSMWKHTWSPSP